MMLPTLLLPLLLAAAAAPADKLADARAALEAGRPSEAASLLTGMLTAKEGDEHAVRLLLADAQIASAEPDRALATLEPIAKAGDAPALRKMGEAFRANGDRLSAAGGRKAADAGFMYEQAVDFLGRAGDAGDAAAGAQAGMLALYNLQDVDSAAGIADKLLAKSPKDGEGLLLRGCVGVNRCWSAGQSGDSEQAGKLRDAAIADLLAADAALDGKRPEPQYQLAFLYEQAGQLDKAVDAAGAWSDRLPKPDFSKLFDLAKRFATNRQFGPSAQAMLAIQQRDGKALTALVAAEPDPTATAVKLGWSAGAMFAPVQGGAGVGGADAAKAKVLLAALCAANPKDADLWNNYALAARDVTREYEESLKAYEKALELRPDDPQIMNDTAVILHYYLHRDYDRAQSLYEQAIETATKLLAAPEKLGEEQRRATDQLKHDATTNLENLAKGIHDWKG